ncbi:MAG: hypothetical protein JXA57_15485 [Armatimonadetes bacterium]|nr:hypothetical protein [Armatimonadota bacterium]
MTEQTLSDALGVDQSAVDALARANVRTMRDLVGGEADAIAAASGIPVERIREWQQRARRAGARAGMSPVLKAWGIGAVAILIAVLLGYVLMSIGSGRLQQAEQIRVNAESKLQVALSFAAGEAVDELRKARLALHNQNWGSAQTTLSSIEDKITFMERIAPESRKADVAALRDDLSRLQSLVSEQSNDVMSQLDSFEGSLVGLQEQE